jgi:hypothetical protein
MTAMTIKTLAELQEPDERTLRFSPLGLGGRMRPEDAVDFQQHVVARHNLVAAVAEGTRQSFEQLRTIFGYGLLCYDIYTLVNDHALLVFEQALRDRFIDFHQGTVTFVSPKDGQHEDVAAEKYEQVRQFVSRHRGWRLRVGSETISFNAMLGGLLGWARAAGLFRGQRNRGVEQAIARLRNLVAHPDSYHLTTPVDAADTIGDLAEIINHLWGSPTPGGALYPAPVRRTIVVVAWNQKSQDIRMAPLDQLPGDFEIGEHDPGEDDWSCVLVRGVPHDWDLMHFDARYETARYPAEWLWGPCSAHETLEWLRREQPEGDQVDILDRLFMLRFHEDLLYLPQSPDVAAAAGPCERPGMWYVVRADSPVDAFSHMRQALAGGFGCARQGRCRQCPVEVAGAGSWQQAIDLLARIGVTTVSKRDVPDARVPCGRVMPRWIRILKGSWDIPAEAKALCPATAARSLPRVAPFRWA